MASHRQMFPPLGEGLLWSGKQQPSEQEQSHSMPILDILDKIIAILDKVNVDEGYSKEEQEQEQ
jgi:hypothetical protein